ncbi:copper chaperone PCu(A)C [Pseudogemmobacter faecipullorum]|uniref:Copper chaperone PCu(A)C n=1 Tax=Pseudogemmobacter faecipullorum TaxID=2755041 RepID=A0ABS8CH15_9RHOB|nr:copper chaperone PCu(A)C [Pseudogemmobacter faecipullorum]MCB5408676.1 copper chaperone PCu(A)C [Pseudogemmobacter faecipullorum]
MKTRILALCAALALTPFAALAHSFSAGDIAIGHPFIPTPAKGAKSAGGYLSLENNGTTADRLIAVETDAAAKAELHTVETDAAGVTKMIHLEGLDIPAGETVTLERGGYHIMLMGLTQPLEEGARIPATLIFEKAGKVAVEFSVDAPKAAEDHSGH